MQTRLISTQDPQAFSLAVEILQQGGLVAFPTDTVYGLAAHIQNTSGIELLYEAKQRAPSKAIAVLMSSSDDLSQVASEIPTQARQLAEQFWPGPLTLIVPRHPALPEALGPLPTIGVRVPNHPDALALMDITGPLAVTSANLSGETNACSAQDVLQQLDGRVDLILDGGITPGGTPSTVVDCTSPILQVLRSGPISSDELFAILESANI